MNIPIIVGGLVIVVLGIGGWTWFRRKRPTRPRNNTEVSELKVEQLQIELLLQSVADGIIITDTQGKITLINPAAAELTEWPAKDAINLDVRLIMKIAQEDGKPLSPSEDPFSAAISNKESVNKIIQLTGRNGTRRIISLVTSPLVTAPSSDALGLVTVLRDISQQHHEEMQRAEFISTASHEMRTPVAAIEGYLALAMNDKVSKIDAKARDYLDKAHTSTQHLGKLFQDLLTSAKAEDGRLSNNPIVLEMSAFLEQLSEDLRFTAEKKGLRMEYVVGSDSGAMDARKDANSKIVQPLYYVHVDPDRLREVISNLFDNAVKYTESGKVSIGLTGDTNIVQFYIRDTGAGIPSEDLPHLFQKFYRVNNTLTRTIGGTGLGLFISRKIIELYGGRVWVESESGKGSTFFINLPRLSAERASELHASETSELANQLPSLPVST